MGGITLAKICNRLCLERGISKAEFYSAIGVTAPSFHGWTKGAKPQKKYIDAIEKFFDIDLSDYEKLHIAIPRLNALIEGKDGKLVTTNPTTLYGLINKLCKRHGLPQVGVHGLRHSFASLAYHLKWSESTTMREGGWADNSTVYRIYTHLANADANADIVQMQQFYASLT